MLIHMAHVIVQNPSAQTVDRALSEGTPEHFTRVCRGHASRPVRLYRVLDRGFTVPSDGIWMINGFHALPGETRDLVEGDMVTYHRVQRAADNDAPVEKLPFITLDLSARRADPETGRLIRMLSPEQAVADAKRRGRL